MGNAFLPRIGLRDTFAVLQKDLRLALRTDDGHGTANSSKAVDSG